MRPNRVSRWILSPAFLLVGFCVNAPAQHLMAPSGCYPPGYRGDVWVGRVTKADDATREITLRDVVKGKVETFVGVLEKGYLASRKSGRVEPLKPSDIPIGLPMAAFYSPESKKVNGKKVPYNLIVGIDRMPNRKPAFKDYKAFAGGLNTPGSMGVIARSCAGEIPVPMLHP